LNRNLEYVQFLTIAGW